MTVKESHLALGIDIGGTGIRVGLVTPAGEILTGLESLTPPEGDPATLCQRVRDHAHQLLAETGGAIAPSLSTARPARCPTRPTCKSTSVNPAVNNPAVVFRSRTC
ncbi:MAG: ROK family protein [Phycisphaerae bacterium]|nr:ROK family protein [Phycisphaerae bacterium]